MSAKLGYFWELISRVLFQFKFKLRTPTLTQQMTDGYITLSMLAQSKSVWILALKGYKLARFNYFYVNVKQQ